jgi:hypothetical protein
LGPTELLQNALLNISVWLSDADHSAVYSIISRDCKFDRVESYYGSGSLDQCSVAPVVSDSPDHVWRAADVEYEQFTAPDGVEYDTWLCTIATINPSCAATPFLSLEKVPHQSTHLAEIKFVPEDEKTKFRFVSIGNCRFVWANEELTHVEYVDIPKFFKPISPKNASTADPSWQEGWDAILAHPDLYSVVLIFAE